MRNTVPTMTRPRRGAPVRLASAALCAALATVSLGPAEASASAGASPSGTLTVSFGNGSPFISNFNPFSATANLQASGLIYEPLWFWSMADSADNHGWLATSYSWSDGGKSITFQLRRGVTWTDGTPFTSADVAYTFNLLAKNADLNPDSLPITSAVAHGPYAVTVHFSSPAYTDINYIAGTTYIVPEHIWKSISDPTTWADASPVGTGSYEVSKVSPSELVMTANPHYYMAGLPHIETLRYLYFNGNTANDLAIESGSIDWGGAFIPNIKTTYESHKGFVVDAIPAAIANIIPNFTKTINGTYNPMSDLAVREAFSDAINRTSIDNTVYDGESGPINDVALVEPLFSGVTAAKYVDQRFSYSDNAAASLLKSDGYTMSNGQMTKDGKPLTVNIYVPDGWTDYQQDLQLLTTEEAAVGITVNVDDPAFSDYASIREEGTFDAMLEYYGFTPSPYVYYKTLLDGQHIAPVGTAESAGDYGRFNSPALDSDLNTIATLPKASQQVPYFARIETIVAQQLPAIPLFDQQGDTEFNGNVVAGYPTLSNPYAEDVPIAPDYAWVTPRLYLK
jgi:peptide/nickel transport system substrate-binding protein